MEREEKLAMYDSFFKELEDIEKVAMFQKVAGLSLLRTVGRGFQQLASDPTRATRGVGRAFEVGSRRAARAALPGGIGPVAPAQGIGQHLSRTWGGLKNVARTPAGQALGVGAAAGTLGVGALGAGAFGAGRLTAPQRQ